MAGPARRSIGKWTEAVGSSVSSKMLLRQASKTAPKRIASSSKCLLSSSVKFSTSAQRGAPSNEPLKLDPSYQQLFKDVHISLQKTKMSPPQKKDLQVVNEQAQTQLLEMSADDWTTMHPDADAILEEQGGSREARKSPAAAFGSKHIGTVIFPLELQMAINQLIAGARFFASHRVIFGHQTDDSE